MKNFVFALYGLLILLIFACSKTDHAQEIEQLIEDYRIQYAPDKRVAIWDIKVENDTLKGETDQLQAFESFLAQLEEIPQQFCSEVQVLPSVKLEGKTWAVVTISVANIRSQPKHSAELATQALMGTPLKVLKGDGSWYLVQTPDDYISWVDQAGIQLMTEQELENWYAQSKVVFTPLTGHAWAEPEQKEMVSDLVAGNILTVLSEKQNYLQVQLPDARKGWVPMDHLMSYEEWINSRETSNENLINTAKSMLGVPYLWGGTSIKGMDCSGFTKTIFYLNGQVIPRDASQQIHEGEEVDIEKNWQNLQVGDLLFFGEKATEDRKERVVHVGMWIGNNEFIHSRGRVRISSFDPQSPHYDEYELNRYLRTKRIVNQKSDGVLSVSEIIQPNKL
ncbi:SH3 domain-containing protein [Algoriphagus faecimaris]|uniref:SH3 domain-containing protein n=1 Tax=Algoriphagus faecimaris TaxID=686796 RepID=A0A1G6PFD1_9BACT|nr:C40 family peptidase [Algoriphagus faecimaris]SDC78711.1 SH3 domain-containing protein [Algoriphagus faecimaris]